MKKNKNNEELQSRREFFKKAAKGVLPIIGAVVLASAPGIVRAADSTPMGCNNGCYGSCHGTCASCASQCSVGCGGYCRKNCSSGCAHSLR